MSKRAELVARGLRTKRNNSPAFRRSDLAKRATALRLRYERIARAWMECGSVERGAQNYARALRYYRLATRLSFAECAWVALNAEVRS